MVKIITEVCSVLYPKIYRISWIAVLQDGYKQRPQLVASGHLPALSQTFMPLIVICQKTTGQTGLTKGGKLDILKGAEMDKGCSTLDSSEKEAEIEALASLGCNIVDATN